MQNPAAQKADPPGGIKEAIGKRLINPQGVLAKTPEGY